jgi:phosphoribosylaminoimidazolecarboxamide formyltransferase / IMP cyclohydrolase
MAMTTKPLALVSVTNKTALNTLTQTLRSYRIIASSGSARALKELSSELDIVEVADFTGSPEILGGRVKTLHPKIFSGLLLDPKLFPDEAHSIEAISLVIVNLYDFANHSSNLHDAIQHIDIGGSALLRASAKKLCQRECAL